MSTKVLRARLRRPTGDDGQAVTWLIVVGLLGMGMLAMKLALPLAEGGDRLGKGQTGAESAALAGAKDIRSNVVLQLLRDVTSEDDFQHRTSSTCSSWGSDAAADLAQRNDEDVVSYCYDFRDDRVRVTVHSRTPTSTGHRVEAKAEAKVGMPWGSCRFADRPTPSTTTTPPAPSPTTPTTPATPTTPPPPPDVDLPLDCGPFSLHFVIDGDTGKLRLENADDLLDRLEPRLTR
ncbi:hypothetical protein [Angustibacter luteus]|uniref:Flp pilus-assembly TadG-like N-terminal domain-containing protein n=1 Tax=Angustibacter luteus TaxID=658456 RepID=A0ABW1J982_9ACTN